MFDKVSRHIKGWKKDQLKQELKYNDMKVGGNMQQLRMRIANCVVRTVWLGVCSPASSYTLLYSRALLFLAAQILGVPPTCPRCNKRKLVYNEKHSVFECLGYYDQGEARRAEWLLPAVAAC